MNDLQQFRSRRGMSFPHFFQRVQNSTIKEKDYTDSIDESSAFISNLKTKTSNELINAIRNEAGEEVLDFISNHIPLQKQEVVLYTTKQESLYNHVDFNNLQAIVNLLHVNKHRHINLFFRSINKLLPDEGVYVGCVETYDIRKKKLIGKFGKTFATVLWFLDFIFNRVIPRIKYFKSVYYFFTRNRYHVISLAETLGRLVYNGFEIIEYKKINHFVYFIVKKVKEPRTDSHVSYGPFFGMYRIGKNGKIIKVYKFRTMHPYSEYLQDYVLKLFGYNEKGKPANDFRLTGWGRIFRKFWLDELPQVVNVFRGELSIVGVRPLSQVRFNQFPDDLKKERIKYKPGCIPPYVALCMPDARGNIEAERIYFEERKRHPVQTNVRYFFMAVYNIVTNKISSS